MGLSLHLSAQSAKHKGPDSATAQAEIAKLEKDWVAAIVRNDVEGLKRILADDFVRPSPEAGQFVDKDDVLEFFKSGGGRMRWTPVRGNVLRALRYPPSETSRWHVGSW